MSVTFSHARPGSSAESCAGTFYCFISSNFIEDFLEELHARPDPPLLVDTMGER